MGLFDKIKSAFVSADGKVTHSEATFATRPDTVYAPASGVLLSLQEVNDQVISAGLLGDGYGILPTGSGVLYAPVSGRISVVTVTNHAIGLRTDDGMEVLMHIGIDTVKMEGKGFTRLVEANDVVHAGQPLITFDVEAIKLAATRSHRLRHLQPGRLCLHRARRRLRHAARRPTARQGRRPAARGAQGVR